jgi:endo-1,4-beta-D-glucanase Y
MTSTEIKRDIRMSSHWLCILCIILLAIIPVCSQTKQNANISMSRQSGSKCVCKSTSNSAGAYYSGKYHNLFSEVLGLSELEVKSRVNRVFNQLFYGNDTTQRVYFPVGSDMAYIKDINNNDVRTEGMSYGMMIAVQMDKKKEFDRLWKWAKTYMQHQTGPHKHFFAWHCRTNGSKLDLNAASDGEEWFVMDLFLASARWGDGDGIFNYRAEAESIADAMLKKESDPENDGTITNMFSKKERQVVFVPTVAAAGFTDPSYHVPHFYELWARWADKNNQFWEIAASTSREFLKKAVHPVTGLAPDYANFDGTPHDPWRGGSGDFRFDAWRVAMNVAVDYMWFARDDWAVAQSNRLLNFFHSEGNYINQYTLDGKRLSSDESIGLCAMNAVSATVSTSPYKKDFIEAFWNAPVPTGKYRYYDGILSMLAYLQVSGNFKIYRPARHECQGSYLSEKKTKGSFTVSAPGTSASLLVCAEDYPGVLRVAKQLQSDIASVTNTAPQLTIGTIPASKEIILIGTIGKSPLIDRLVDEKKLDIEGIAGRWESSLIQVVEEPLPDVDRALVIAGSDKRGTIYGMYDLSEKIGVSPWHWWADVPVKKHSGLFVLPGRYTQVEPKVKYRGIFLNDEAPALAGMAHEKFGGFNSEFYEHIFELILRLKGNYLWPAMWDNSFATDDTLNMKLADEYGVVMGTSHHEPMMRAWKEWVSAGNKKGSWDYAKNPEALREFWKTGIERTKEYETIVTLAMRGDGDEPMTEDANISLLQTIITDQRKILGDLTGKDVTSIPQVWALYKEVQEYYDKGMRVPDDVTLLLCDDNWGDIRRLPFVEEKPRSGGYGIYYHFDFVGGPRNYKWLNTTQIERVWEQMHLASAFGANRLWIVNVGDLKPMEFPISFFFDYAWDPGRWPAESLPEFTRRWAEQQFGSMNAQDIADILMKYTKYNARRKPEMLSPGTYSIINYREAETVVSDYTALAKRAQQIQALIPGEYKDAFYQLVLHPVLACSNLNELYYTVGKNLLYAQQGREGTNDLAVKAASLYANDSAISYYYNRVLANGKWNHMMDQTHIGYTYWQQPDKNLMPRVMSINPDSIPSGAEMGIAIEGSTAWWPMEKSMAVLPEFDPINRQSYYIEIFNRGKTPFTYSIQSAKPWIQFTPEKSGTIEKEQRIVVSVDWKMVPHSGMLKEQIPITVTGPGNTSVIIQAVLRYQHAPNGNGYIENNGCISIEAEHFSNAVAEYPVSWQQIPNLGRTLSAMTPLPVTASAQSPGGNSPRLEYQTIILDTGTVTVNVYLSPTLNFHNTAGLRYAISFDDEKPQIINMHEHSTVADWKYPQWWNQAVSDNIVITQSTHFIGTPGKHVVKFWMVDPGVVLQRIVIGTGEIKPSYLGPPESTRYNPAPVEKKKK